MSETAVPAGGEPETDLDENLKGLVDVLVRIVVRQMEAEAPEEELEQPKDGG